MVVLNLEELRDYVNSVIVKSFHDKRIEHIHDLKLKDVLKRKNPYLYRAKNILTAHDLVKHILDAYLSSQEETVFGDFMEGLAIFVCSKAFNGEKSAAEGIDLEFMRDETKYLVSIKSGPNWGNSGQIKRMESNFRKARTILRGREKGRHIEFVNGCCYGRDSRPDKGDYLKLCGQDFWELISGDSNLYVDIIKPIGYRARDKNPHFHREYARVINKFTLEFGEEFCDDGLICWDKLVKFISGKS